MLQKSLPSILHPQGAGVAGPTPGTQRNRRVGGDKRPGTLWPFMGICASCSVCWSQLWTAGLGVGEASGLGFTILVPGKVEVLPP